MIKITLYLKIVFFCLCCMCVQQFLTVGSTLISRTSVWKSCAREILSHKKAEVNQQYRVFAKQNAACFIQNFDEDPPGKYSCI